MVNASHSHGNQQGETPPQALTENPNEVQSFSPGLPREAVATLGGTLQNLTADLEAARSAKFICGYLINPIRPIPLHYPPTNLHPKSTFAYSKSTVNLGCEPLIKVENGLRPPLPPTRHKPIIRPENKGIKPKSNRHKPKILPTQGDASRMLLSGSGSCEKNFLLFKIAFLSVLNTITAVPDKVPYLDLPAQLRGIRKEIDAALARALDNCTFCLGPDVVQFEKDFAQFCSAKYSLGFNSGTSALHIALKLLNIKEGDEVITTPYTFIATSWAISYVGAKPVYVDIDDATFNMDPSLIERAITPRTKAILPVHLYGQPFDVDRILEICCKHKLPLVEDACQAHGAKYKGKVVGTFGEMSCFSFYPAKNLGACGEGGALVTNNPDYEKRGRALREHGSTVRYHHDEIGYNYRMEGFQGAVLGVKLKYLDKWTQERRRVARRYSELLAGTPLRLPQQPDYAESAWHLYTIRHPKRDQLKKFLEENGIGCAVHYPVPLHLQKAYAHLGYKPGDFPVTEKASRECLSLPFFPELTEAQISRVVEVIEMFPF